MEKLLSVQEGAARLASEASATGAATARVEQMAIKAPVLTMLESILRARLLLLRERLGTDSTAGGWERHDVYRQGVLGQKKSVRVRVLHDRKRDGAVQENEGLASGAAE